MARRQRRYYPREWAQPQPKVPPLNSTKVTFDCQSVRVFTAIDNEEDLEVVLGKLKMLLPLLPRRNHSKPPLPLEE